MKDKKGCKRFEICEVKMFLTWVGLCDLYSKLDHKLEKKKSDIINLIKDKNLITFYMFRSISIHQKCINVYDFFFKKLT